MNEMREKEAISAYLKLLQAKGAVSATLHKRALFLDQLSSRLTSKTRDSSEYRTVIEDVMETIPTDDWHESLTVAREFYPFWLKDIKAIAAMNINPGFDIIPAQWKPDQITLKALTDSLVTEKFDTSENWPLKAYAQALRHEGAEQSVVETRVKLVKIILIRLRNAPEKNNKAYRTAVDLTLPLFNLKQNRRLFLVIVREFYHFWSGNPEAAKMVFKEGSDNFIL